MGLDPGTAHTLIYVTGRGVAVNQPSLVTIRTSTGAIEAVGGEAQAGLGRTPRNFHTARPIRAGIISDLDLFDGMLHRFLHQARIAVGWRRLAAAIAVPAGMTDVERRAAVESLRHAGATSVVLVDQVLAAARGAGIPMDECRGRMVVSIGAGITEAAIISLGGIVCARTLPVGGNDLDAAIAAHVRSAHQLLIGEPTAERLKIRIGSALANGHEASLPVRGRSIGEGVPRQATVGSGEVQEAMAQPLQRIVNLVRETLEQAPPELSADIADTGIVLTGGTALLRNLDRFIAAQCGVPVAVAGDPLSSVILGLGHQLGQIRPREWRRFGYRG